MQFSYRIPSSSSSVDHNILHLILSVAESLELQEAIYGLTAHRVEQSQMSLYLPYEYKREAQSIYSSHVSCSDLPQL